MQTTEPIINPELSFSTYDPLAAARQGDVKITAIKALQLRERGTIIKVETDTGVSGYGECHAPGPMARAVIDRLAGPRLPHLDLIGKDPLAIEVHFHNMFYAYPQRGRVVGVLSGIDIALWDLAGKLLNQPVSRLLGGNFRERLRLYSHIGAHNFLDRAQWRDVAQEIKADPRGFTTFKIDVHHILGVPMQQYSTSISPQEAARLHRGYVLAREELGDDIDIIVHCHCELDVPSAIRVAEAVEPIKPIFFEDPLAPHFSEAWMALRRTTRLPIMTGENLELAEQALPFLQNQAVDMLQPDLINSGGITGVKKLADLAALYRIPICLHNVSGLILNMASQQFSAAFFNCPMLECTRRANELPWAVTNPLEIKDGHMTVSTRPGLGLELDMEYLKAHRAADEPWWGDE